MSSQTRQGFSRLSIILHWLSVPMVLGLFILGLWMSELDYYSEWYRRAPHIHKSVGLLLFALTLLRLVWTLTVSKPLPPAGSPPWECFAATLVQHTLYLLLFLLMFSGYLISTADGRAVAVFNWFEVPALPWSLENQEDIAGEIHAILAFSLIGLIVLHAGAALKHHFFDKDDILRRMLGLPPRHDV